jgi:hypothetical protein
MTDKEIAENPTNILSILRRIKNNSNHPDSFKRLAAILCFSKLFVQICVFEPLVSRFTLEICHSVLDSLKLSYEKQEQSYEVVKTTEELLK